MPYKIAIITLNQSRTASNLTPYKPRLLATDLKKSPRSVVINPTLPISKMKKRAKLLETASETARVPELQVVLAINQLKKSRMVQVIRQEMDYSQSLKATSKLQTVHICLPNQNIKKFTMRKRRRKMIPRR